MTNIAIENGPFIDYFCSKTSIYGEFSMAMLNNQMVGIPVYSRLFSIKSAERHLGSYTWGMQIQFSYFLVICYLAIEEGPSRKFVHLVKNLVDLSIGI